MAQPPHELPQELLPFFLLYMPLAIIAAKIIAITAAIAIVIQFMINPLT